MDGAAPEPNVDKSPPVFGFILLGGPLSGALIRDIRLANELSERGFAVHVWWAVDRQNDAPLKPQITQHWLFHGFRYLAGSGNGLTDRFGRFLTRTLRDKNRIRGAQKRPQVLERVMGGVIDRVCNGVEGDPRIVQRFAKDLNEVGVTHLLPMLGVLCPWAAAARRFAKRPLKYLVTFQGYELYVSYARNNGAKQKLFTRLVEAVDQSDWPAIAVSDDYVDRVAEDIGVPKDRLRGIPPGVPANVPDEKAQAADRVAAKFPQFRRDVPLVSYLGRRDTEKGIDLLLYAANILRRDGLDIQVAICGPTLFGQKYSDVCRQLADDLRCPVMWSNHISDELRTALFFASRCVVYPSIHREPFGMVPVEAMAHGTPVVVPDYGGVAGAIQAEGETGGLHFRAWDSADLADKIATIAKDEDVYRRLSEAGPRVAAYYSVENLADRVLSHLGLPRAP